MATRARPTLGAEGVYAIGAVGADRGLAIKLDDGSRRGLGALVVVPAIALLYAAMPISALITGLQTLLQFIGVVLLFVPSSNAWFRAIKVSKRAIKKQQEIQKAAQ